MNGRHGGDVLRLSKETGRAMEDILDFSANINPLGPPAWLPDLINSLIGSLVHYPDPHYTALIKAVAENRGVLEDEIVVGNGSSEILYLIPRALGVKRALIPVPAYGDYAAAAALAGLKVEKLPLKEEDAFVLNLAELEDRLSDGDMVFIGQPSNPTGHLCDPEELRALAIRHRETKFIIDEAFADFINGLDRLVNRRPANMIVLCSMTKFYAIPGLRLGFAVADRETANPLRDMIPTWSVNTLAQAVGEKALRDREYEARTRSAVHTLRERLSAELKKIPGLTVYPGKANFLLVRVDRKDLDAPHVAHRLLSEGIAIRLCANMDGLDERFFRTAVRTEAQNIRLCKALESIFHLCGTHPAAGVSPKENSHVTAALRRSPRPKPAVQKL